MTNTKMKREDRRWPHGETEASEYSIVHGKSYYRFSGRGDDVHLQDGRSLCGKPSLSNNYARYKPIGIICPKCSAIAKLRSNIEKAKKTITENEQAIEFIVSSRRN
jgi:hypothetical protein